MSESLWAGLCWRQEYRIENEMIRPTGQVAPDGYAPLASLSWSGENKRGARPKKREDVEPPPTVHAQLRDLDLGSEGEILAFTRAWGLLGIQQHSLRELHYVPTVDGWVTALGHPPWCAGVRTAISGFDYTETRFLDELADSRAHQLVWEGLAKRGEAHRTEDGQWVMDRRALDSQIADWQTTRSARMKLSAPHFDDIREANVASQYARYFPDLAEKPVEKKVAFLRGEREFIVPAWPAPGTTDYWRLVGEPLKAFKLAVQDFRTAADLLARLGEHGMLSPEDRASLDTLFRRGLRGVQPRLIMEPAQLGGVGTKRQRGLITRVGYHGPSLLSACYLLLLLDAGGGRLVRPCENCGVVFDWAVGTSPHCSQGCYESWYKRNKKGAVKRNLNSRRRRSE